MRIRTIFAWLLIATPIWGCASPGEELGALRAASLDTRAHIQINYLLYLPERYDAEDSWPLLLFLHGGGERGDDLELVKIHGPPKLIAEGKQFPFIVVAPQSPMNQWWQPAELIALLDTIESTYKVDKSRVYVSGLSLGGFGTWRLAQHAPDRFAAIAPICGGGETYWAEEISRIPVWAFHGAKDTVVPLERTQAMIEALREKGATPKLTIYPEAGHDSWTETYSDPKFYAWLLEQKKEASE